MNKQAIKELLRKDYPVILEIGANYGTDTEEFLKMFGHLKIYCFEPDPRAIAKFKNRINDKRCTLYELAISDKDGEVAFYFSGGR